MREIFYAPLSELSNEIRLKLYNLGNGIDMTMNINEYVERQISSVAKIDDNGDYKVYLNNNAAIRFLNNCRGVLSDIKVVQMVDAVVGKDGGVVKFRYGLTDMRGETLQDILNNTDDERKQMCVTIHLMFNSCYGMSCRPPQMIPVDKAEYESYLKTKQQC